MHFFTSITLNYLPKARVLAKSVKQYNPGAIFVLVLNDEQTCEFNQDEPFDHILKVKDIVNTDNLSGWIFKHSVVELCTAVKAAAAINIINQYHANKVVYLDPDIVVFDNLENLNALLDKYSLILTPHITIPENAREGIIDNEICTLKHGIYNLGFFAVNNSTDGLAFLNWWNNRLMEFCYDDIPNGLFTDQRWVDFAPAFFENVFILRDSGHNVATWNLSSRNVTKENDIYKVNNVPLRFFHFSGYDAKAHHVMLKKYANGNNNLFDLSDWYAAEIAKEGQAELGSSKCSYLFYDNGKIIENAHRVVYRNSPWLQTKYPDPYSCTGDSFYNWVQAHPSYSTSFGIQNRFMRIVDKIFPKNTPRRKTLKNIRNFFSSKM